MKERKIKISTLQVVLTVLYVTSLLISNVITSKQVLLPFDITMTGAIFIFPITYVLSDVFSEVYGYKWSRFSCYLAFAMNLLMVIVFSLVIVSPSPDHWTHQEAFQTVLGNTPRVLFASLLGYVLGDLANDKLFRRMKTKYPNTHRGFGWRAILSSFVGEAIDSAIFLPLAFYGLMPNETLIVMAVTQVFLKTAYEVVILPLTKFIVVKVSEHETIA